MNHVTCTGGISSQAPSRKAKKSQFNCGTPARSTEGGLDDSNSSESIHAHVMLEQTGTALSQPIAVEASSPELVPRFRLLGSSELYALPTLSWRVRGVLPAFGLAGLYGPSASGKSFLALSMAAAIAEGEPWFGCRVEAAPVVYVALEGEAGLKLRVQAWEAHHQRTLPANLLMMIQTFKLTEVLDVDDLAAVVPAGAVVFIDTLNRAAPTADENSSRDMGDILEGASRLQRRVGGLVVLIHHSGKDVTKGLRGHSSLFAALDAAIEVSRQGNQREWRVAKVKDGQDGNSYAFSLLTKALGVDKYDESITSCVVVSAGATEDVIAAKLPQGGNQMVAFEVVREVERTPGMHRLLITPPACPEGRSVLDLKQVLLLIGKRLDVPSDRKAERAKEAVKGMVRQGLLGSSDGAIWLA
jgi:putative DNA primase/helicase